MLSEVPVVDVGPLRRGEPADEGAAAIDTACHDLGAFFVVGHGVADQARTRLAELATEFFALPESAKSQIAMAHAGRAGGAGSRSAASSRRRGADLKEGVYFGAELGPDDPRVQAGLPLHGANLFPKRPAGLRPAVLGYMAQMTSLAQAILEGVALGLGLPRSWFADDLTAYLLTLFRMFRYPPDAPARPGFGVGEHTDYGLITVLGQDGHGGLQIRGPRRVGRRAAPTGRIRLQPGRHARTPDRRPLPSAPRPRPQCRRRGPPVLPLPSSTPGGTAGSTASRSCRDRPTTTAPIAGTTPACMASSGRTAPISSRRWRRCSLIWWTTPACWLINDNGRVCRDDVDFVDNRIDTSARPVAAR